MVARVCARTTTYRCDTTQRILRLGADANEYLDQFDRLGADRAGPCPFCRDGHRLWAHGHYSRGIVLLEGERAVEERIPIKRFLCARTGQTVSLLPDFCLPRRRYGVELVGLLLSVVVTLGASLAHAFARWGRAVEGARSAQTLVAGFVARRPRLEAYVARLRHRTPDLPTGLSRHRREVARLFLPLLQGQDSGPRALRHHGRRFHDLFRCGIA